jgi:hypothetical protein
MMAAAWVVAIVAWIVLGERWRHQDCCDEDHLIVVLAQLRKNYMQGLYEFYNTSNGIDQFPLISPFPNSGPQSRAAHEPVAIFW